MKAELRLLALALLAILLIVAGGQNRSIAGEKTVDMTIPKVEGVHDFDFLHGDWEVANRRLKHRHAGSTDWDDFPGFSSIRPVLGGLGNVDELRFPTQGWAGATLRLFNPESRRWSIYWINSRDGLLQPPVHGSFEAGAGVFFGDDLDEGRPVRVRFRWTVLSDKRAHWEQAFSTDGEKTWETNWTMDFRRAEPEPCCKVVELRQYTLKPGQRETLTGLFDRELVEGQERHGMRILGQFRDIDCPERFVWLRGFAGMDARRQALTDFYGGPEWAANRDAANATLEDVSNVLLLRPASDGSGIDTRGITRAPVGSTLARAGIVAATVYPLQGPSTREFAAFFDRLMVPELVRAGARIAGRFVTEDAKNDFPKLPVREGERVFVSLAAFENLGAHERHLAALAASPVWRDEIEPELRWHLRGEPEVLRLAPTARSLL